MRRNRLEEVPPTSFHRASSKFWFVRTAGTYVSSIPTSCTQKYPDIVHMVVEQKYHDIVHIFRTT